jgi:serine/threonine protein kinase
MSFNSEYNNFVTNSNLSNNNIEFSTNEKKTREKMKFNLSEFIIDKYINFGHLGHYHFCHRKKSEIINFIKIFKKSTIIKLNKNERLLKEIEWYLYFSNTHLLPTIKGITINDPKYLGFLFDFIPGGTLRTLLDRFFTLTLEQAKFYIANLLLILDYLHKNKFLYRDLNPENILIKENGYVTLLDFSYAKKFEDNINNENDDKNNNKIYNNNNLYTTTLIGKPNYIPPEMILNKPYNKSCDFWALGIILYELLCGVDPYKNNDPIIIYQNILEEKKVFPKNLDRDAKFLINHLLNNNPEKRYGCLKKGILDIKEHRVFNDFKWNKLEKEEIIAPFVPKINNSQDIYYYSSDKRNKILFEKYEKIKEIKEEEKIEREKEMLENKTSNNKKKDKKLDFNGIDIIDSDTEALYYSEDEDIFQNW